MAITKVPNGPLIKKKGPFKGSTLKNGGPIKKAQLGSLIKKGVKKVASEIIPVAEKNLSNMSPKYNKKGLEMAIQRRVNPEAARKKMTPAQRRSFEVDDSYRKNGGSVKKANAGGMIKRAQNGDTLTVKKPKVDGFFKNIDKELIKNSDSKNFYKGEKSKIKDDGFFKRPKVKSTGLKNGGLIKRADGSFSKPGLWDNIRKNKGSGKKPTKQMLVQEKKIKAKK